MKLKYLISLLFGVFIIGWLASTACSSVININESNLAQPQITGNLISPSEKNSPSDWVKENQITVLSNKVILDIKEPYWATFTDTNSMDPVIDVGANTIEIIPESVDQIKPGDIVAYESDYADGIIIHRVSEIGFDKHGWYARMKGDNISWQDPGKVRFEQIKRVVVAIVY